MSVTVAAWNVKEGLAEAERMPAVVEGIMELDADVVALPDAYSLQDEQHGSSLEVLKAAKAILLQKGYNIFETEYKDEEKWHHDRNIVMLSRLAIAGWRVLRLDTRNAMELKVPDPHFPKYRFNIIGLHGDDRSRSRRLNQTNALLNSVADTNGPDNWQPTVACGDFNAVHINDRWPRLLRSSAITTVADHIPIHRIQNVSERAEGIITDTSLEVMHAKGFRDVDRTHQPTFHARFPVLQLDHIMISRAVACGNVRRFKDPRASDHIAIAAELYVNYVVPDKD